MPVNIHGKMYELVEERLRKYEELYPDFRVETKLEHLIDNGRIVFFTASIFKNAKDQEKRLVHATGWACEKVTTDGINKTSHVENCETSAIGRALANANIASVPGSPRPSAQEMQKAKVTTETGELITDKQLRFLKQLMQKTAMTQKGLATQLGITIVSLDKLTKGQASTAIEILQDPQPEPPTEPNEQIDLDDIPF